MPIRSSVKELRILIPKTEDYRLNVKAVQVVVTGRFKRLKPAEMVKRVVVLRCLLLSCCFYGVNILNVETGCLRTASMLDLSICEGFALLVF